MASRYDRYGALWWVLSGHFRVILMVWMAVVVATERVTEVMVIFFLYGCVEIPKALLLLHCMPE